jgi:parallel beta-helix repeat protein
MMRKNNVSPAALLFVMSGAGVTLLPTPARPLPGIQHLYVSPTGSDTNAGTAQAPFRTIPRTALAAAPGTIIHVAPGVYDGGFKTLASGTETQRIYYRSEKKWGAKLVPPIHSESEMAWDNRGDYVTIEGFEIDGTATRGGTSWSNGIYAAGSHDIVAHNLVHDIGRNLPCTNHGGSGIGTDHYYYGIANNVIGNIVHDIGPGSCSFFQGIYISTSGDVINNVVYNIASVGIHLWHDANNVKIINNTVAYNGMGILVGGGDQYHTSEPNDYTKVVNNIVVRNRIAGIKELGNTGSHNVYLSNLVAENGGYDYQLRNRLQDGKPVKGDPKFKKNERDLHLSVGSPAIDSGVATDAPSTDIDGTSRPQGAGYDVGAYEYVPEAR